MNIWLCCPPKLTGLRSAFRRSGNWNRVPPASTRTPRTMEFFERIEHMGKKNPGEKASQLLSKLADVIAEGPDVGDLEIGNYTELYVMRLEKAKRAYGKAKNAL